MESKSLKSGARTLKISGLKSGALKLPLLT